MLLSRCRVRTCLHSIRFTIRIMHKTIPRYLPKYEFSNLQWSYPQQVTFFWWNIWLWLSLHSRRRHRRHFETDIYRPRSVLGSVLCKCHVICTLKRPFELAYKWRPLAVASSFSRPQECIIFWDNTKYHFLWGFLISTLFFTRSYHPFGTFNIDFHRSGHGSQLKIVTIE